MDYVQKTLLPNEQIRFVGRTSRLEYLSTSVAVVIFGALTAALASTPMGHDVPALIFYVPFSIAVLRLVWTYIIRQTTEICVTDRRIIHKWGLISRSVQEMNVSKVETVLIHQGVLGRIMNFGTVDVRGTGGGIEDIRYVVAPINLRRAILGHE